MNWYEEWAMTVGDTPEETEKRAENEATDEDVFCAKKKRDAAWRYHRHRHYDKRCPPRFRQYYSERKGTDGFYKWDKLLFKRLLRRYMSRNENYPTGKSNFYRKTAWWDPYWY